MALMLLGSSTRSQTQPILAAPVANNAIALTKAATPFFTIIPPLLEFL